MRKLLFNDKFCLTQEVLAGNKTMTRRLVKEGTPLGNWEETVKRLPYKVGDIVAIAQPYKDIIECMAEYSDIIINVDGSINREYKAGWNNKMFVKSSLMPHHIRITDVKIERLQDISEEDALREGIFKLDSGYYCLPNGRGWSFSSPRNAFAVLIDKVGKKGDWDKNPLVAAYTFELVD